MPADMLQEVQDAVSSGIDNASNTGPLSVEV